MYYVEEDYIRKQHKTPYHNIVRDDYVWNWTDDDAAIMSVSGCVLWVFFPVMWLSIYVGENAIFDRANGQMGIDLVGVAFVSALAWLVSLYLFGVRKHPLRWKSVGFRSSPISSILGGLLMGVLFVPVNVTLTSIVSGLMDAPIEAEDIFLGEKFQTFPIDEFLGVFFMMAVLVPIAEEAFFRGMLFRWLRYRSGLFKGVLISSVVFGALHFSIPSMISISLIGVFCALAYERTKSIWPSIAIHAGNNGVVVIVYYFVMSSRMMG